MSKLNLLEMKQVLGGLLGEVLWPFLDPHDVMSTRTSAIKWNNASKCGPHGEILFSQERKSRLNISGNSSARHLKLHDFMRVVEQESVLGDLRDDLQVCGPECDVVELVTND